MERLKEAIRKFIPYNEQEEKDKERILRFMEENRDSLHRENETAHFTTSIWTVNKERTKTLMVYHKIYDSWSWIGGHADGEADLSMVAMRELFEETGITQAKLLGPEIYSLEVLTVDGHQKKGRYVPSHLHLNITYLAEADENETLKINEEENKGVRWFELEDALCASTEPWMVERVYRKLIGKMKR